MRALLVFLLALLATTASAQDAPSADATTTLTGVVTDAETGEPVVGAGVVIPALGLGGVSQRDGRYAIEGVPPGTHAVRAAAFAFHFRTVEAEVGAADATLDFALEPGEPGGCASHDHGPGGGEGAEGTDG